MCRRCGNNNDMYLDTVIYRDDDTVVDQLCPNCMARTAYDKEFPRAKGVYTSELSGAHGALKIVDAAGSDELPFMERSRKTFPSRAESGRIFCTR